MRPTCQFLLDYEDEDEEDEDVPGGRRRKKPWRYCWPDEVRDDVLARLLQLNRDRAEAQRLLGPTAGTGGKGKAKPKGKGRKPADDQMDLL